MTENKWNPRYVQFVKAHGLDVDAFEKKQAAGYQFTQWNSKKWIEFAKFQGLTDRHIREAGNSARSALVLFLNPRLADVDAAYDAWLTDTVTEQLEETGPLKLE